MTATRTGVRRTALVTGATAGIGAAFAELLAREGFDLVVVARDTTRLEALARDIRTAYGVDVEVLPADLTADSSREGVEARLADRVRPVDLLVNNAGGTTGRTFARSSIEAEEQMLRLNVVAVMHLTKAVLPVMIDRGSGGILNVASIAAFAPYGSYSATKAWVVRFSESMAIELAPKGIRVLALCPGFVHTEFHERAGITWREAPSWAWLDADDVAAAGWAALRAGRTKALVDWRYSILVNVMRFVPFSVLGPIIRFTRRRREA